jgi:hypothetical protein
MNLTEIKVKPINELVDIATELGLRCRKIKKTRDYI